MAYVFTSITDFNSDLPYTVDFSYAIPDFFPRSTSFDLNNAFLNQPTGTGNLASYYDMFISDSRDSGGNLIAANPPSTGPINLNSAPGLYDWNTWCAREGVALPVFTRDASGTITGLATYNDARVYSTYTPTTTGLPSTLLGVTLVDGGFGNGVVDTYYDQLQAINYLFNTVVEPSSYDSINKVYKYDINGIGGISADENFTMGDIQAAIWTILGTTSWTTISDTLLYNEDSTSPYRYNALATWAINNGSNFIVSGGNDIVVIVSPNGDNGSLRQPLFIEIPTVAAAPAVVDISGYKWTDSDGNAQWNGSESGLGGWTIYLDTDTNPNNGFAQSQITSSSGAYSFNLTLTTEGTFTYYVYEASDPNWTNTFNGATTITINVTSDVNGNLVATTTPSDRSGTSGVAESLNFGNFQNFSLSGTKYEDVTGDGISADDSKLAGVTIFIDKDDSGTLTAGDLTTTTAGDGTWSFNNLGAGYSGKTVYEVLPTGYTQTVGQTGYVITGTSGTNQTGLDFANFQNFSVSGTKYEDITGDGITDDDSTLAGVTIFIDKDNSGTLTAGDLSTLTAGDGTWSFSDLDYNYAGKTIYEVLPTGYTQTVGQTGYTITGTSGANQTGLDFANFENVSLSGYKWQDTNGDTKWDAGESGISGWTIYLENLDTNVIVSDQTDASGKYEFTNLTPGQYLVYEDQTNTTWTATFGTDGWSFQALSGTNLAGIGGDGSEGVNGGEFNFGNYKKPPTVPGLAKTPGFWKQDQHFQYWPTGCVTTDSFRTTFGLQSVSSVSSGKFVYGSYSWFTDTLLGALNAKDVSGGVVSTYGNVSALGRAATAALLNAKSDELNANVKGSQISYVIDQNALPANVLATLDLVDLNDDKIIGSSEVITAVQDAFGVATANNYFVGAAGVNSLASALDAMNNMGGG